MISINSLIILDSEIEDADFLFEEYEKYELDNQYFK